MSRPTLRVLPDGARVLTISIDALTTPSRGNAGEMVALLVGPKGSGATTRITLSGSVPPDYIALTFGEQHRNQRIWARSRQLFNTVEYHLTDDSTIGFPTHVREVR